jgi:tetraacyldisaccharide 4'-kinase
MREPAFWWQPGAGTLLSPFGAIYGIAARRRLAQPGTRAGVPVICLGNLTVGGAGKTPAALLVAHILLAAHARPFFLSRGYGGRLRGPVRVELPRHRATHVGDEPLMLARLAPTIVARDRVAGARAAREAGAGVIVMDDGFQNPSLVKDLAILLIDGRRGIGNGRIFPAGPLRAPLDSQIERAQAVIVVGPADIADTVGAAAARHRVPILHGRLEPDPATLAALSRCKVLAFAGIGNPDKFFATLTEAGITVAERRSFPDHHRYRRSEAKALMAQAQADNLMLVTTEKDHVRLTGNRVLTTLAARAGTLPVRLVIDEQERFRELVLSVMRPGLARAAAVED